MTGRGTERTSGEVDGGKKGALGGSEHPSASAEGERDGELGADFTSASLPKKQKSAPGCP